MTSPSKSGTRDVDGPAIKAINVIFRQVKPKRRHTVLGGGRCRVEGLTRDVPSETELHESFPYPFQVDFVPDVFLNLITCYLCLNVLCLNPTKVMLTL